MSRCFIPVALLLACSVVMAPAEGPALSFLPPSWDFGSLPAGGEARAVVTVTNGSAETLAVSFIPMCHCLAVEPDRQAVPPGTTVEFRIRFSATPDDPEGPVSRLFVVSSEAPGQKTLLYEVRGTIARADRGEIELICYFLPGCRSSERLLGEEIPTLCRDLGISFSLERRDVLARGVYEEFMAVAARLGDEVRAVPGIHVQGTLLQGEDQIRAALPDVLRSRTQESVVTAPLVEGVRLDPFPVFAGGVQDAVTPCAVSTLVLVASFLVLTGCGRREVVLVGSLCSLAMLATSSAMGLGVLSVLRSGESFPVISRILRWMLVTNLVCLAIASIRDWMLVRRGRDPGIARWPPLALKQPVHVNNHGGAHRAALVLAALGAGTLMSAFEFICTCRVTLPALAGLARIDRARGIGLMTLYHAGFIAPSIAGIIATFAVASSPRMGWLFRRCRGAVKAGLAGVLLGLAILVLFS